MRTLYVCIFIMLLASSSHCNANSDGEIIRNWLNHVANGIHDLKQPLFPSDNSYDYVSSFPEMKNPPANHFLKFIQATEGTMSCWERASGGSNAIDRGFFFSSKTVHKEVITKILNRRLPIINNFAYDMVKYDGDDPKYICRASIGCSYDYLGLFWIRLLIILFVSEDYRFQVEAENLLLYIKNPPDPSNWYERQDQEAFFCLTSHSRKELPWFLKTYISACKASKQKSANSNIE